MRPEAIAPEPIGPVPGEERITVIDCLRGAALFGILTANMRGFAAPVGAYTDPTKMWSWPPDLVVQALVDWLVSGKFITIFATLFGIGFAIQMDRAAAAPSRGGLLRAPDGGAAWHRPRARLRALVGRHPGALRGLRVLPAPVPLPAASAASCDGRNVCYWFLVVLYLGFYISTLFGTPPPQEPEPNIQEVIAIYSRGTFAQIFALRAREWMTVNSFIFFLTRILGLFLFGLYHLAAGVRRVNRPSTWTGGSARSASACRSAWSAISRVGIEYTFHPEPMRPTLLMFVVIALHGSPCRR